jgi:hypothetical protein
MPSPYYNIASAVATALASVSGIPATIAIRKDDALYGRDTLPMCIVSMPDEDGQQVFQTLGSDNTTDLGTTGKVYRIGVTIYTASTGNLTSSIDTRPALVLAIKQAIGKPRIGGLTTVTDYDLVSMAEWEDSQLKQGAEVTRIIVNYTNAEARNG